MGNAEFSENREFGTGLRAYLESHGVRLDARLAPPSNLDLLELCTVEKQSAPGVMRFHAATA